MTSTPSNRISAARCGVRAGDGPKQRGLARPVRTHQGQRRPFLDGEGDLAHGRQRAVPGDQGVDFEDAHCSTAQVGVDHPRVLQHLVRRAVGDHLAGVHAYESADGAGQDVDDVLDPHDRDPRRSQPFDGLQQLLGFGIGQAAPDLIEEQDLGPGREGPGELEALAIQ